MQERKIDEVLLYTNRKTFLFDSKGDGIPMDQTTGEIGPYVDDIESERKLLRKIQQDGARIEIVIYNKGWAHEITFQELCYLLGHGKWWEQNYGGHQK